MSIEASVFTNNYFLAVYHQQYVGPLKAGPSRKHICARARARTISLHFTLDGTLFCQFHQNRNINFSKYIPRPTHASYLSYTTTHIMMRSHIAHTPSLTSPTLTPPTPTPPTLTPQGAAS